MWLVYDSAKRKKAFHRTERVLESFSPKNPLADILTQIMFKIELLTTYLVAT